MHCISGTSASDVHYQAYLLEGLYRWNQDRASQAVEAEAPLCHTYSGLLRHAVNQLAQTVLGSPLDPAFQHPRVHTGELIGVEYLYSQTGKALQEIKEEDEDLEEDDGEMDEGFGEEVVAVEDLTIPEPDIEAAAAVMQSRKLVAGLVQPPSSTAPPPSSTSAVRQLRSTVRSPRKAARPTGQPNLVAASMPAPRPETPHLTPPQPEPTERTPPLSSQAESAPEEQNQVSYNAVALNMFSCLYEFVSII